MHWRPQVLLSGGVRRRASLNTRCTQYSVATRGRSIGASASQAAETSAAGANPYPFPEKPRPTPHEIFHLSPSANAKDIKLRYYELARIYHPDAVRRAFPLDTNQKRWNAISAAYDILRHKRNAASVRSGLGSTHSQGRYPGSGTSYSYTYPAAGTYAGRRTPWGGFDPDGNPRPHPDGLTEPFWMSERTLMVTVLLVVCSSVLMARAFVTSPTIAAAQHHLDAAYNLEQARRHGKEQGEKRRQELRAWIEEGGMKGMASHIGKGRSNVRAPDEALDAQEVDDVMHKLERTQ